MSLLLGSGNLAAQTAWPQGSANGAYSPYQASGYQQTYPEPQTEPQTDPQYAESRVVRQPLGAGQLEQLVAPIALYSDALVAQVLGASTYPAQVVDADRWRQSQGYATGEQIAYSADVEPWAPSVKALTAFPQVLAQMDRNLQWTTDLGNAYYNQPQDVLEAVQIMRSRAQAAGNLQSTPQEIVRYDQGNIELVPANPQVVYVPTYNPWSVYGDAVTPYPGFSLLGALGNVFGSSPIRYGLGIALSAFSHTPWGWLAWGLNWLTQSVLFHQSDYYSNSATVADWGFPHRGHQAYLDRGLSPRLHEYAHTGWGSGRGEDWRRGGTNSDGWRSFARGPDRGLERRAENWDGRSNAGFESARNANAFHSFESGRSSGPTRSPEPARNFESARNERGSIASHDARGYEQRGTDARSAAKMPEERGGSRSAFDRGAASAGGRGESYRASGNDFSARNFSDHNFAARNFSQGGFAGGKEFTGRSSGAFTRSSMKASHSGGLHLFGGKHSQKSFDGGHSSAAAFHGGKAPKGFGGGKAPKGFGGGKSFGGGHSHGGGHSGGHGGGHSGGHRGGHSHGGHR